MAIVGFNFTRTNIERTKPITKGEKIATVLKLVEARKEKLGIVTVLKFLFEYEIKYGEVGKADLAGEVLYSEKEENLDSILKYFNDAKQLPPNLKVSVLNAIFYKCNLKVLTLSEGVGLPPHFQIPSVKIK